MKRFFAIIMIMILLTCFWNGSAFAEDGSSVKPDTTEEEALEKPPQEEEKEVTVEVEDTLLRAMGAQSADDEEILEEVLDEVMETDADAVFLAVNEDTPVKEESITLTVGEKVYYGGWVTNYFYINDQLAYCLEPEKKTPAGGDYIAEVLDNKNLTKGMYYLMGGPGFTPELKEKFFPAASGYSEKQIYAFCHAALSFIYCGYDETADIFLGLSPVEKKNMKNACYFIRDELPAPPDGSVSINPAHQNAYWDKELGCQKTDPYQIQADAGNVLTFTLPAGVTLHNLTTGVSQKGTVSVKGKESFCLEAEADVSGRWESGKLKGSIQDTYMSFLIRSPGEGQDIGGLSYHKEPLTTAEFSVEWMSSGMIQIQKICGQTGNALAGAEFDVCARDDIVKDGVEIAKAGEVLEHVVTGKNGTVLTPMLPVDAYYIVRETKAPEGYAVSKEAAGGISVYLSSNAEAAQEGVPLVSVRVENDLINCDFSVHKVIKSSEIVWANGNPTFLFEITGEDLNGQKHTYSRIMEYTEEYVKKHMNQDGTVTMTALFDNIPCGRNYMVTEENVNRFLLTDVKSQDSNVKITRLKDSAYGTRPEEIFSVKADLFAKPSGSSVTFYNSKIRWDDWSHNADAVNSIKIK